MYRSEFEDLCERQYRENLESAKNRIDCDECPLYWDARPRSYYSRLYIDFPQSEAYLIIDKWSARLREEIVDYQRQRYKEEERERELKKQEKRRREAIEERERERRHEEEERRCKLQRDKSLKTLMSPPYNFDASLAEDFIDEDGEINEEALTRYENARKNKEKIAKKIAEWEAQKDKPTAEIGKALTCPSCGTPSGINDKFCRKCGAAIQKQCPSCKKLQSADDKFCRACGTKL